MAYDVVKTIGNRQYRYRVESYRDPESGRVRNRWTYVGRAGAAKPAVRRRVPATHTRERLIEAFLRLVERMPYAKVTPGAVSSDAGVAHGTFYRYFRDRQDIFETCTRQANEELDARLSVLAEIAPSVAQERERLRTFVLDLMRRLPAPPGLMRAWLEVSMGPLREARRAMRVAAFVGYIEALRERGFVDPTGNVRALAIALTMQIEMLTRRHVHENAELTEDEHAAAVETFDRLVFWQPPRNPSTLPQR